MSKPGTLIVVAITGPNAANAFWSPLIGKQGVVTSVGVDGLWDVVIGENVIEGVRPDRFTVVEPPAQVPLTKQVTHRVITTLIVLGILGIVIAIVGLMNKVLPS